MPDVALSTAASPLAALLSGGSSDSKTGSLVSINQTGDPFAALLANAGGKAGAVAALLAQTTLVMTKVASPVAASTLPFQNPIEMPTDPDQIASKSDDSAGDDTKSDDKDEDTDPLGDAIASGATAVLALAPAIAPPVPAQAPVQVSAPTAPPVPVASSPAPTESKPVKLGAAEVTSGLSRFHGKTPLTKPQSDPTPDDAAKQDQQPSSPNTDTPAPAAVQLPADVAKAVIAALKQGDAPPAPTAQDYSATAQAMTDAAKIPAKVQPKDAVVDQVQPQKQAAAIQSQAPLRRDADDVPAPRRAGDARKRTDAIPTDATSLSANQNTAATSRPAVLETVAPAQAKGDAIVHQTLAIAKDGAWLDRLAHDIASMSSGNDLHFKLSPQNLGSLSVAISQSDEGASIRMTTTSETTRDILVDAQPKLMAEARAQGLKVSDAQVDVSQDRNNSQNQGSGQDTPRWGQNQSGQNNMSQNGQNQQSSPGHQPFVSNLRRKAEAEPESPEGDSDALYA